MEQPDIDESYERGFVAGMQEQMKRSVDRAVNASADDRHYTMQAGTRPWRWHCVQTGQ